MRDPGECKQHLHAEANYLALFSRAPGSHRTGTLAALLLSFELQRRPLAALERSRKLKFLASRHRESLPQPQLPHRLAEAGTPEVPLAGDSPSPHLGGARKNHLLPPLRLGERPQSWPNTEDLAKEALRLLFLALALRSHSETKCPIVACSAM